MRAANWSNRGHGSQGSAANSAIRDSCTSAGTKYTLLLVISARIISSVLSTYLTSCMWSRMNSMLRTDFKLSDVEVSDAQDIGHYVEVPAMQNGPLYRTMFPQFNTVTEAQKEQITRWYIEMLKDAFQAREENFLKACSVNGTPVGFCGWTIIEQNYDQQQAGEPRKREKARKASWLPDTLDVDSWVALSKDLKAERYRVLKDLDSICRKLNYIILVYLLANSFYI